MKVMRGPWSFLSQEWGLVVEGFEPESVVMAPYNPPEYAALLEAFGLAQGQGPPLLGAVGARRLYAFPSASSP
jgi:hypothetical protein